MIKRKIVAFLKYPEMAYSILKSEDVFTGGLGIVLLNKKEVIKIRIESRLKKVLQEESERGILEVATLEQEQKKFIYFNKKNAYIYKNRLVLERINAVNLSTFLDEKERFLELFEKSIDKLCKAYSKDNYAHCDFHMDNILIDSKDNIYFIDFDFIYDKSLKNYELEADILKFVFYFKVYYNEYYLKYLDVIRTLIFNYFDVKKLEKTAILMKKYLKDEMNELF